MISYMVTFPFVFSTNWFTGKTMLSQRIRWVQGLLLTCNQEGLFFIFTNQKLFLNNTSIKISLDGEAMAGYLALKSQVT